MKDPLQTCLDAASLRALLWKLEPLTGHGIRSLRGRQITHSQPPTVLAAVLVASRPFGGELWRGEVW